MRREGYWVLGRKFDARRVVGLGTDGSWESGGGYIYTSVAKLMLEPGCSRLGQPRCLQLLHIDTTHAG